MVPAGNGCPSSSRSIVSGPAPRTQPVSATRMVFGRTLLSVNGPVAGIEGRAVAACVATAAREMAVAGLGGAEAPEERLGGTGARGGPFGDP
jgi:hypothetical protein